MNATILFDLDGTLVDSAPDLRAALDRLMKSRGLPPFTRPEVVAMVGDGVRALVERGLAARGLPLDEPALDSFTADYTRNAAVETRPYPGIEAMLERLSATGWRMAVCTNKPVEAARNLLGALGLLPHLAAVGGGDSFAVRKPDPGHLLETLRLAGGTAEHAIMVGDHHNDVAAAAAAGIPCVFAAWGYGKPEMAGAVPVAESVAALPALLDALRQRG